MDNKTLWIMCGPPASGKSFYATHTLQCGLGWSYVSRDIIRFSIVGKDEEYFSHEKEVFNTFVENIVARLNTEGIYNVIADATHLNWVSRKKLIKAVEYYLGFGFHDLNIIPVFMNTPIEVIEKRNSRRTGRERVPDKVLRDMNFNCYDPKTDPYNYDGILYVNYYGGG